MKTFFILFIALFALVATTYANEMWHLSLYGEISLKDIDIEKMDTDWEPSEEDLAHILKWVSTCMDSVISPATQGSDAPIIDGDKVKITFGIWFASTDEKMNSGDCSKSKLKDAYNKSMKGLFGTNLIKSAKIKKLGALEESCVENNAIICGEQSTTGDKPPSGCVACSYSSATMASVGFAAIAIVATALFF